MLHATALGLGDEDTATLAQTHLADYAKVIVNIGKAMPGVVLAELALQGGKRSDHRGRDRRTEHQRRLEVTVRRGAQVSVARCPAADRRSAGRAIGRP